MSFAFTTPLPLAAPPLPPLLALLPLPPSNWKGGSIARRPLPLPLRAALLLLPPLAEEPSLAVEGELRLITSSGASSAGPIEGGGGGCDCCCCCWSRRRGLTAADAGAIVD